MTTDKITTISGVIIAIAASVAMFFPELGPLINGIAKGVAAIFVVIATYFMNKPGKVSQHIRFGRKKAA